MAEQQLSLEMHKSNAFILIFPKTKSAMLTLPNSVNS